MNKLLNWATGAGKTKETLDLIGSLNLDNPNILVLVPERQNIQNWRNEIEKWSPSIDDSVTIKCYASLKKYADTNWDVLVLDECHHIATVRKRALLDTIKADNIMALSATPGESKKVLESLYGKFDVSKKPLNELIDQGRLPKPEVFVYDLDLDYVLRDGQEHSERVRYDAISNRISREQDRYRHTRLEADKYKMLQSGLQRKRMLGEFKIPYVSYLLNKIDDKRYICFCPTIDIARTLYTEHPVGSVCVDSKLPKEHNDRAVKDFNDGNYDHIFCVGMLTEGANLQDVDAGVLIQLDKGERTMIQKFGRTLRSEHPKMYFFRFLETIDDELVKNVAWNIDSKHITNFSFKRRILENG